LLPSPFMSDHRRLIVFDFDGTLADSWRDIATALNSTLREAGLAEASPAQVRAWIGEGLIRLLERALPAQERTPVMVAGLAERFSAHYERCCLDTTTLYPGVLDCLGGLAGDTLAILSNKPAHFLDRMVTDLGLAARFKAVVGGDVLPARKPDSRAFDAVARAAGVAAGERWMIGDSALDVATGRAAGAHTIGCAWGMRGREELETAGAEFVVEHPAEIPALIAHPLTSGRRNGHGNT
jgi:phosphoglycolate phosphatase